MQTFDRDMAIEALVASDKDYILSGNGLELLDSILEYGHRGYTEYSDLELATECRQRDIPESYYTTESVEN